MRWPIAFSIGVALTVATLGIKAVALYRPEPVERSDVYLGMLAARLERQGFAVAIDPRVFVVATRGACRMKLRDLPPMGTNRLAYERLGTDFGPTRYAWRGDWYDDPPKYRPLLVYYAQRELARLGIAIDRRSIVAVSAGSVCTTIKARQIDLPITLR